MPLPARPDRTGSRPTAPDAPPPPREPGRPQGPRGAPPAGFYADALAAGGAALAPMAGFTDAPFRRLCREAGSAWAVTEMVSAKALVLGDQRGIEIGEPYPGEPGLVIQLFAADPELAGPAARMLAELYRPAALDLNMGCPVKKVVNKGCGAELMRAPERAAAVVAAMREAAGLPVSAKMRLGWDRVHVREVAEAVVEAGAALVAVHGRTAAQRYEGEADWSEIVALGEALPVPVVGSGDVSSREEVERYRAAGVGVMIARAAMGRPWIFAEVRGGAAPDRAGRARVAWRHAVLNAERYGEAVGLRRLRGQLGRYLPELREGAVRVSTLDDLAALLRGAGLQPAPDAPPAPSGTRPAAIRTVRDAML